MSKTILLLRHAEEPEDQDNMDLSEAGRARAEMLASFILETFGQPDFIFASAPTDSSVRTYLTMRPLADAVGRRIDGSYKTREFAALASKLMADPMFDDKRIVVCWTHHELPALAASLHVRRKDFPERWGESVFDLIFSLIYKSDVRPKVKSVKQG